MAFEGSERPPGRAERLRVRQQRPDQHHRPNGPLGGRCSGHLAMGRLCRQQLGRARCAGARRHGCSCLRGTCSRDRGRCSGGTTQLVVCRSGGREGRRRQGSGCCEPMFEAAGTHAGSWWQDARPSRRPPKGHARCRARRGIQTIRWSDYLIDERPVVCEGVCSQERYDLCWRMGEKRSCSMRRATCFEANWQSELRSRSSRAGRSR